MMDIMEIGRLLLFDLRLFFSTSKKKILLLVFIVLVSCLWFDMAVRNLQVMGVYPEIYLGDYFFYAFSGIDYYVNTENFYLPELWVVMQFYFLFLVCSFPFGNLYDYGQQILLRSGKRKYWWLEKCLWTAVVILLMFMLTALIVVGYCLLRHVPMRMELSRVFCRFYYGFEITSGTEAGKMMMQAFLVIPLVTIAAAELQMTIGILTRPQIGFITALVMMYLSIYLATWRLPGNNTMLLRYEYFSPLDGINVVNSIKMSVIYLAVSIPIGMIAFSRTDLVKKMKL